MNVKDILTTKGRQVITISPNRTVQEAAARLTEHRIGALVVVDDAQTVIGLISERDIVREVARGGDFLVETVGSVMTKEPTTGLCNDSLDAVTQLMTERRFRHLPIMENGELVGIISIGDVLKAQRDRYHGEVDTLQTHIMDR